MTSISLPLKMLVAGTALAGLTLLACGEDSGGGSSKDDDNGETGGKKDAGTVKRDGGTVKRDGGAGIPGIASGAEEGAECTGIGGTCADDACDEPPCGARCEDGFYGACSSLTDLLAGFGGDAGVKIPTQIKTDAGTFTVKDGSVSVSFGDGGSFEIPPMTCPDELTCGGGIVSTFIGGAMFCQAAGSGGLPPVCTTQKDCTDMGFTAAMCTPLAPLPNSGCVQICK